MSYASVAAHKAPPPSEQPRPDPALLNTAPAPEAVAVADDISKVGVVSHDFKEHPATVTSEATIIEQYPENESIDPSRSRTAKNKVGTQACRLENEAHHVLDKAEEEGCYAWSLVREQLLRPGVAGGLIGIINVGLIGGVGYTYYTQPHLRRDSKAIGSTIAVAVAIFSAEGYGVAQYRKTSAGQEEERRAREEGAVIYCNLRKHILRPGVLGGLLGLVNIGILGSVGYLGYREWDRRTWDKRYVSAITAGLLTLWTGEGYIAEQYHKGKIESPKP